MTKIQMIWNSAAAICGAVIGFLFGELTGLFFALIAFMALDYISGVIVAVINKKLSSAVGFKGLAKKLLILVFVAIGHMLDTYVVGNNTSVFMTAVILFYLANEGISIIENAAMLGLPVPKKIIEILEQLKEDNGKEDE